MSEDLAKRLRTNPLLAQQVTGGLLLRKPLDEDSAERERELAILGCVQFNASLASERLGRLHRCWSAQYFPEQNEPFVIPSYSDRLVPGACVRVEIGDGSPQASQVDGRTAWVLEAPQSKGGKFMVQFTDLHDSATGRPLMLRLSGECLQFVRPVPPRQATEWLGQLPLE